MTELRFGQSSERDYGTISNGVVLYGPDGDCAIPVTERRPAELHGGEPVIVFTQGLTTGPESMAVPAREAARLGAVAVTLEYINKDRVQALECNADVLSAVIDAFHSRSESVESKLGVVGWSMGGAVETIAAGRLDHPIDALHHVSPGGFTHGVSREMRRDVVQAFALEGQDQLRTAVWELAKRPHVAKITALGILRVASDVGRNCRRRPRAVLAELMQLLDERRYDDLEKFRRESPDSRVVWAYSKKDRLIPGDLLLESLLAEERDRGIELVTDLVEYFGGHSEITWRPELIREILRVSGILDSPENLPDGELWVQPSDIHVSSTK